MKKILVPVADGFEEIETITIVNVLRRAGLEVTLAGLKSGELIGARKIRIVSDKSLDEALKQDFDVLVLPGGQPGVDNLRKDSRILNLIKKMYEKKKWIGAICAAPLALRDAGIISGRQATSHPSVQAELSGVQYQQGRVVMDEHIVTSRAAGTAMEFALKLVEILEGKDKAQEVKRALLFETK